MPKFIIERECRASGGCPTPISSARLANLVQCASRAWTTIQWVESYVTGDKIFCVYIAPSEELIPEHAKRGGFPANQIHRVERMIDPTTAELAV